MPERGGGKPREKPTRTDTLHQKEIGPRSGRIFQMTIFCRI